MKRSKRIQYFKELSNALSHVEHTAFDLVIQMPIDTTYLTEIKQAAINCISVSFGLTDQLSEPSILNYIEDENCLAKLANKTPNGLVLPKKEFNKEFNHLHKVAAAWLESLKISHLYTHIFCPNNLRVVLGQESQEMARRNYSSSKIHVDLWSGDPADSIQAFIPLFGDIEKTTVEFYQPPDSLEESYLGVIKDYNEVKDIFKNSLAYPVRPQIGWATITDAIVPHKTLRLGGSARVGLEIRWRLKKGDDDSDYLEGLCSRGRLERYITASEWHEIGMSKLMKFKDSYADAKKGIFTNLNNDEKTYTLVNQTET